MEPIEHTNEDGTVIKVVPVEVAEGFKTSAETATATITAKEGELAETKRLLAERSANFTKYNQLTEEQKKAFNENERNLMMRGDKLEEELAAMKETLGTKEKTERDSTKNSALTSVHKGDEKAKALLEKNYNNLAMPEGTADEINARVAAAAVLSGIAVDAQSPLTAFVSGEAPKAKAGQDFVESPEGAQAAQMVRDAMGLATPK